MRRQGGEGFLGEPSTHKFVGNPICCSLHFSFQERVFVGKLWGEKKRVLINGELKCLESTWQKVSVDKPMPPPSISKPGKYEAHSSQAKTL